MFRVRTLGLTILLLGGLAWAQTSQPGQSSKNSLSSLVPNPFVKPSTPAKAKDLPNAPSYTPLTPKQKFKYFLVNAKSPLTFVSAGITAAGWHAYGDPPYGVGMAGFGKSYAAALSQREIGSFLQRFAVPTLFHEDPRYFAAPKGDNTFRRGVYAASRVVLTQSDDGQQRLNASYMIGGLASAAIGNAYIRQHDFVSIGQNFLINMATDAGMNILREFWPGMRPKIHSKELKKAGDVMIGSHGQPNPHECPKNTQIFPPPNP